MSTENDNTGSRNTLPIPSEAGKREPGPDQAAVEFLRERIPAEYLKFGTPNLLNRGSTGVIFRLGPDHIVKAIDCTSDPVRRKAAENEIRILEKLEGAPGVIPMLDFKCAENEPVFILELYHTPLPEYARANPFSKEDVFFFGTKMAIVLEMMRRHGVLHLDITPKNICTDDGIDFYLCDFGSAKTLNELKQVDTVWGTPAYMAPEAFSSRDFSEQSEIYSLGMVMYCLLHNGALPLTDRYEPEEAIQRRLAGEPIPDLQSDTDPISKCLAGMLSFDKKTRTKNFEALEEDLSLVFSLLPPNLPNYPDSPRSEDIGGFETYEAEPAAWTALLISPESSSAGNSSDNEFFCAAADDPEATGSSRSGDTGGFETYEAVDDARTIDLPPTNISDFESVGSSDFRDPYAPADPDATGNSRSGDTGGFETYEAVDDAWTIDLLPSNISDFRRTGSSDSRGPFAPACPETASEPKAESANMRPTAPQPVSRPAPRAEPKKQPGLSQQELDALLALGGQKTELSPEEMRKGGKKSFFGRLADKLFSGRKKTLSQETPAPAPVPRLSEVQFSAVFPDMLQKGAFSVLEVIMFEEEYSTVVDEAVTALGKHGKAVKSGILEAAKDTLVTVHLDCSDPNVWIGGNDETQKWIGKFLKFSFSVKPKADSEEDQLLFIATVYFNGIIATRLHFTAVCSARKQQRVNVVRNDIDSAFISYSRKDLNRVIATIQGMRTARPDLDIFFDLDSIHTGDYWEDVLRKEIERRDMLFLCWSLAAKDSEWVNKEWHYALEKKGLDGIEPIAIDKPSVCPPPNELAAKHFNDRMLFFMDK